MDEDQKRAFDFVVTLRNFYGDYGSKKEREAYATAVLYLGVTVAALQKIPSPDLPNDLFLVGLTFGTLVSVGLVFWQLWNRHFAARMVAACTTVASRWLGSPPAPEEYRHVSGPVRVGWPSVVAEEYCRTRGVPTLCILIVLPTGLLVWGAVALYYLYRWVF